MFGLVTLRAHDECAGATTSREPGADWGSSQRMKQLLDPHESTPMSARRFTSILSRTVAVALSATLAASACSSGTPGEGEKTLPPLDLDSSEIVLTSALETVNSCDDLLTRLRAEASDRVGPYGFGDGGPIVMFDDAIMADDATDEMAEEAAPAASLDAAQGSDTEAGANADGGFSGTNNQESSVDEADLVKTDGRRLVTVSGSQVNVLDVTDDDDPRLVSTIKLPEEFWGGELFLNGDSALLMTSGWTDVPFLPVDGPLMTDLAWYPGMPTGRLMELDLDRGEIVRTLEFEGSYLSAREVEGTIRIALGASANRFAFVFPSNPGAEDSAEEFNRKLVEQSTIDQWIPTYRIVEGVDGDVVEQGPIVDCDRVYLPGEFAGFGSLVILTTDLDNGLDLTDSVSVFTDGQTVYSSTDRMVVATPRWPEFDPRTGEPQEDSDYRTALHTFDITDLDRTDYVASGSVKGTLLSRYSLSEYDGYLRVATTDGTPWNSSGSESFVTVLDERDQELVPVGQVGGLGEGERIFAVRFLGDLGYVVTFEQIDPLYVVDLSDPANPTVKGELKIPGFSTYLHPLDDGLLLAVGVDGDEDGVTGGSVVSLFDVSDPDDPRLLDKLPLSDFVTNEADNVFGQTYSPVDSDPRAFTYWDDTAIIPVGWWLSRETEGEWLEINGTEAVMVTVDGDRLVEVDRVSHPMRRECEGDRRSVSYIEPEDLDAILAGESLGQSVSGGLDPEDDTMIDDGDDPNADEGTGDAEASFVDDPEDDTMVDEPASILPGPDQYCWTYSPEIVRTVVVGDTLYTVAHNGIGVHDFDSGSRLDWIPFEGL